jgi:hypothetical protein
LSVQTHGEADAERLRQQRELQQALRSDALAVRRLESAEFAEAGVVATVPAIPDYEILEGSATARWG